jgi:hypothetical protein
MNLLRDTTSKMRLIYSQQSVSKLSNYRTSGRRWSWPISALPGQKLINEALL